MRYKRLLLLAAVGCAIGAVGILLYRRDVARNDPPNEPSNQEADSKDSPKPPADSPLLAYTGWVGHPSIDRTGRYLAFCTFPKASKIKSSWALTVWDLFSGKEISSKPLMGLPTATCFSPDGSLLAVEAKDEVYLQETASWKSLLELGRIRHRYLTCMAFSPDGKTLVTGSDGDSSGIRLWDVKTGNERLSLPITSNYTISSLAFRPGTTELAVATYPLQIWDTATGKPIVILPGHLSRIHMTAGAERVTFSPDGKTMATCGGDRHVKLWDTDSWTERCNIHTGSLHWLVFSPDSTLLAGSSGPLYEETSTDKHPGSVQIWDSATGKPYARLTVPSGGVDRIVFTPDGKRLFLALTGRKAEGHPLGSLRFWTFAKGEGLE
jgi:WD40 repeat protein